MIFQHHRFQIWNKLQHPYSHDTDDLLYNNPSLPTGVNSIGQALDYILAVLYPQSKPAVADQASLPLMGNAINDMRVVQDDGDGKAASYRWEQREGEASPSWHKIYDVDWGIDSILQAWQLKTQDIYVVQHGYDDRDDSGNVIAGDLAGQSIFGGASANTNMTLFANSGDGVGPATGYIQFGDNARPLVNNSIDFGTTLRRFKKVWSYEYQAGTLNLQSGNITDSSGSINFGTTNLTTTGTVTIDTLLLQSGSITDSTGVIDFDNEDLQTTGDFISNSVSALGGISEFKTGSTIGTLILEDAKITDPSGQISFDNENLVTTGNINGTNITASGIISNGTLRLNGNTLENIINNSNLNITTLGTGVVNFTTVQVNAGIFNGSTRVVGTELWTGTGRLIGNTLSSTASDLLIYPFTGQTKTYHLRPDINNAYQLGSTLLKWQHLYLQGNISDGTNDMPMSTLVTLKDINAGVTAGMTIFWDGTKWVASLPDTEVNHTTISGLTTGDAGHTQFVMLAGRSGGQSIIGGTAASENLTLESTAHATKGNIYFKDSIKPFTDASYSGSWSGEDIGDSSHRIRNLYSAGEFIGMRFENKSSNPASSSQNIGRVIWNTTDKKAYIDDGLNFVLIGALYRYEADVYWDGVMVTDSYNISSVTGMDARKAIWVLKDITNNYEQIFGKITSTSSTNVTVTVNAPLPAGYYRLIGMQ